MSRLWRCGPSTETRQPASSIKAAIDRVRLHPPKSVGPSEMTARPEGPVEAYQHRLEFWRGEIRTLDRFHHRFANARLLTAGAFVAALWMAGRGTASAIWPVSLAVLFGILVLMHARLSVRLDRARRADRLYVRGLERLAGHWIGAGRDGATFINDHLYARDLDVF